MDTPAAMLRKRPHHALVWAALITVYLVWGSTYLAIRVMVETLPPLMASGTRFLIAGAIFYAILLVRRGRDGVRVTAKELRASAAVGAALLLGGNGLVSVAEREVPSGLASLIIASVPLWVILLRLAWGDKVSRVTLAAVATGFAGVGLLVLPGARPTGVAVWGLGLLVLAAAFWATGSFFSSRLPLPRDPLLSTCMQMLCGGAALMLVGTVVGESSAIDAERFSVASLLALLYLIVVGSLVAFTAYVWVLQNAPVSRVATYAYVNPVVAIFLGWALLSEPVTPMILLGAGVIVASVALTLRQERQIARREPVEAPPQLAAVESS